MALNQRLELYRQLEAHRKRPLIVYVTSTRQIAGTQLAGQIGQDAIPELLNQLNAIPEGSKELDFLVLSNGGDATVAWRIVSLIREKFKKFSILIPQSAFSAATLIALGADEIIMHPHGNLGPTDPQIFNPKKGVHFSSADVHAFLRFTKETVGLTDQIPVHDLFMKFCDEVGFVGIGVAARGAQLSLTMGEKMLRLHMKDTGEGVQSAKAISEALNSKYFHHGYPLSRSEAKEIGLNAVAPDKPTETLLWSVWKDIETDLKLREPLNPLDLLHNDPNCQGLYAPIPQLQVPPGAPANALNVLMQLYAQAMAAHQVSPSKFDFISGVMESTRIASVSKTSGSIFAARQPDLEIKVRMVTEKSGWADLQVPQIQAPVQAPAANP